MPNQQNSFQQKQQQRRIENHPHLIEMLAASGFANEAVKNFEEQFGMLPRGGTGQKGSANVRQQRP